MSTNDGGPAFPIPTTTLDDGVTMITQQGASGMSMRDKFAESAMAGLIAQLGNEIAMAAMLTVAGENGMDVKAYTAVVAWDYAEAMMAERERRYPPPAPTQAELDAADDALQF